jgi:hypothetical protein
MEFLRFLLQRATMAASTIIDLHPWCRDELSLLARTVAWWRRERQHNATRIGFGLRENVITQAP